MTPLALFRYVLEWLKQIDTFFLIIKDIFSNLTKSGKETAF